MRETTLTGKTPDIAEENIKKLKQIFPEVVTEGKIDFEKLKQVLGEYVDDSNERYNFTWNGKGRALRLSQTPSLGTLRPCKEESKDWDTTQNLYIEGDNLEVLKLLQKSYYGKIKMIYIDPPYNTGKDFVYKDDFYDSIENYKRITGQIDGNGKAISTNTETSGRYHTDWLNMMYPRLRLARNLLRDDGVIFISIDDHEVHNLRKICDEVFGEQNLIGTVIQNKQNAKNDTIDLQRNHEYILIYRKMIRYDGGTKILPTIIKRTQKLRDVFEENGEYFYITDSITTRGEGGVLSARPNLGYSIYYNPTTGDMMAVCDYDVSKTKTPNEYEDIYITRHDLISQGYVVIRPPKVRGQLGTWTWSLEKFNNEKKNIIITGKPGAYSVKKRTFVPRESVRMIDGKMKYVEFEDTNARSIWEYSTNNGTIALNDVMEAPNIFDNPKNLEMISECVRLVPDDDFIILDFFSGSATTAHAVMQLNAEDEGNRKFIMVQLPEPTDENSEAYKAGYRNISEIGKERIRRAGEKIKEEYKDKENIENLDVGFKVFKLDTSNIRKWQPDYDNIEQSLLDYIDNFVEGRTELDVVYEIMLKYGLDLTYPVDEFTIAGKKVYSIGYGMLMICLDNEITTEVAKGILTKIKELSPENSRVVFKDNGFKSDSNKTNIKEILKSGGIEEFITI